MFSTEYYYLVAGLRDWTLDSDTKGFDVREIIDEIVGELTKSDREAVRMLYAYYDCENIIARRAKRERHNQLGNLSAEEIAEVLEERNYSLLTPAVAKCVKLYVEADDEDRDEEVVLDESFEKALFEAYYEDLANSKCRFLNGWGEFDRNLRNIAAALAAREAGRSIADVVVGGGDVVEQLKYSSAADFGLRGELQYIDAVISAVSDEKNIVEKERKIEMKQLRSVSQREKIVFPIVITVIIALLLPSAAPLIGCLMLGNLMKECGVTERLSKTVQNELMNIVTIFLGISVGATATAGSFLNFQTLGILTLGIVAFSFGSASGVILAKIMNLFTKEKINPLIGSAGVSAVPMAARVSQTVGQQYNPSNFLLMHAMGPNVAGVIGSAVAAGILLAFLPM